MGVDDVGVVAGEGPGGRQVGPGGEGEVVGFEDKLGSGRGGDDNVVGAAELEEHDGAVEFGEEGEAAVGEGWAEEVVEAADGGEARRARDGGGVGWFLFGEHEDEYEEGEREEDEEVVEVFHCFFWRGFE